MFFWNCIFILLQYSIGWDDCIPLPHYRESGGAGKQGIYRLQSTRQCTNEHDDDDDGGEGDVDDDDDDGDGGDGEGDGEESSILPEAITVSWSLVGIGIDIYPRAGFNI